MRKTVANLHARIARYRENAANARHLATALSDASTKTVLLEVAAKYDAMADLLAESVNAIEVIRSPSAKTRC